MLSDKAKAAIEPFLRKAKRAELESLPLEAPVVDSIPLTAQAAKTFVRAEIITPVPQMSIAKAKAMAMFRAKVLAVEPIPAEPKRIVQRLSQVIEPKAKAFDINEIVQAIAARPLPQPRPQAIAKPRAKTYAPKTMRERNKAWLASIATSKE